MHNMKIRMEAVRAARAAEVKAARAEIAQMRPGDRAAGGRCEDALADGRVLDRILRDVERLPAPPRRRAQARLREPRPAASRRDRALIGCARAGGTETSVKPALAC